MLLLNRPHANLREMRIAIAVCGASSSFAACIAVGRQFATVGPLFRRGRWRHAGRHRLERLLVMVRRVGAGVMCALLVMVVVLLVVLIVLVAVVVLLVILLVLALRLLVLVELQRAQVVVAVA